MAISFGTAYANRTEHISYINQWQDCKTASTPTVTTLHDKAHTLLWLVKQIGKAFRTWTTQYEIAATFSFFYILGINAKN